MGDAFIPLAEDGGSAIFYNPALIAGVHGVHFEPLNLSLVSNQNFWSVADLSFYKVYGLQGYADTLSSNPDKAPSVSASYLPVFYMKYFAFGVLTQIDLWSSYHASRIYSKSTYQIIPAAAFAIPLARGIVKLGYSLQWVQDSSGANDASAASTDLAYTSGLNQGSALSHNASFALTLPVQYNPSFHIVARNILGTTYGSTTLYKFSSNPVGTPENESTSFDAAIGISPKLGRGGFANLVFEMRDLTARSGFSPWRRGALGVELNFGGMVAIRAGLNGLYYPSLGLGFTQKQSEFSFVWYSKEIGTANNPGRDIRLGLQFRLRVF